MLSHPKSLPRQRCLVAEELSDRSLMLLLTVSFIVAATGLFFAFDPTSTGFAVFNLSNANRTAQANVTIVSNVAISVTGGWDFGEGFVNSSTTAGAYGDLNSGSCSDVAQGGAGCVIGTDDPYNYTNWTANVNGSGQVTVQNIGNINISVRASINQSPDRWFCDDTNHAGGAGHLNNVSLNTTGGSSSANCLNIYANLQNFTADTVNLNTANGTLICGNGNLTMTETITVDMGIRIDQRCPATISERYATVTFFGYS